MFWQGRSPGPPGSTPSLAGNSPGLPGSTPGVPENSPEEPGSLPGSRESEKRTRAGDQKGRKVKVPCRYIQISVSIFSPHVLPFTCLWLGLRQQEPRASLGSRTLHRFFYRQVGRASVRLPCSIKVPSQTEGLSLATKSQNESSKAAT